MSIERARGAEDQHRVAFAPGVYDRVVKAAKAGPRHQGDEINAERAHGFRDGVAAPAKLRITDVFGAVDSGCHGLKIS